MILSLLGTTRNQDWEASIGRQGRALASLLTSEWVRRPTASSTLPSGWRGALYDVAFETNDETKEVVLRTPETTYFAIGVERMALLMREAGFTRVRRIDGRLPFFQPVLAGTR